MATHPYNDKYCDDVFAAVINPKGQVLIEFHEDEYDKKITMHFTGWMNQEIYTKDVNRDIKNMLDDDYGIKPNSITKLGMNIFKAGRHNKKVHFYTIEWNLDDKNIFTDTQHLWLYPREIHAYSRKNKVPLGRGFTKGLALLKVFMKERASKEPYLRKAFTKTGIYQLNNGDLVAITNIDKQGNLRDFNTDEYSDSIWQPDGISPREIGKLCHIYRWICPLPFTPKVKYRPD